MPAPLTFVALSRAINVSDTKPAAPAAAAKKAVAPPVPIRRPVPAPVPARKPAARDEDDEEEEETKGGFFGLFGTRYGIN